MAVPSPFFGKREPQPLPVRTATPVAASGSPLTSSSPAPVAHEPEAATAAAPARSAADSSTGSKLTVGPNIKLKGVEITDCDTLVVEGTVEATMDSRVIHIAAQGAFHGSAEIDIAEIHGVFTGQLTVRQRLVIHSSGKVSGTIRYGKVVIEEGGQLSGEIEAGIQPGGRSAASVKAPAAAAPALVANA